MQHFCARSGWRTVALVGVGLAMAGCGPSSKSRSQATTTAAGVQSGNGLPGRGPGSPTVTSVLGPELTITSPAGASWLQGSRVLVEGTVVERGGGGVGAVQVDGIPATLAADGTFRAEVPLEPGLRTIVVEAADAAGRGRTTRHVSVIAGETLPEDQLVSAAGARLTDLALDGLEPTLAAALEGQRAALRQQVLATPVPDVRLTGFDFGRATPTLDCVPGGLRMTVQVEQVTLGIAVEVGFLFFKQTYRGDVKAARLTLDATALATVQDGQPVVQLGPVAAQVEGFSVPSFASDQRAKIQQQFQQAFANAARQHLASALQQGLNMALLSGTSQQTLLGRDLSVAWSLQSLQFDQDGLTAGLAANVAALQRTYGDQAPGSVAAGGGLPSMVGAGGTHNVALAIHQDAMNRTLHAAWRAGALSQELDQAQLDQLFAGMEGTLTTTTLMQAVPELEGKFMPGLPLKLQVEGRLPLVASVSERAQEHLELAVGEMRFQLQLVDPQTGPVTVLEAVCAARIGARLVEQSGAYRVEPVGQPELHVDVDGEQIPGTEALLEQLAARATGPAFASSLMQIQGLAIPAVQGFQLSNLSFQTVGRCLVVQGRVGATTAK